VFFTSQFNISFPKIFDILGAGLLGLLAGFLVWSFVSFLISISPIGQNVFIKDFGFDKQFKRTSMPYMSWWCNLVNTAVACEGKKDATEEVIEGLLKSAEKKPRRRKTKPVEPNEPAEPNNLSTGTGKQKSFIILQRSD
jgi:hypothetical protein